MINSILVICHGNICRSPMAEGLLKKEEAMVELVRSGKSMMEIDNEFQYEKMLK